MAKRQRKNSGSGGEHVPEAPMCSCLVLCDEVIITHAHSKHTLQGIIGAIGAHSLPRILGPYVAYVKLSNVYKVQAVTVSLEYADTDEAIWEFEATLVNEGVDGPLESHTLIARVPPFPVLRAGKCKLKLKHKQVPVTEVPIEIVDLRPKGEEA